MATSGHASLDAAAPPERYAQLLNVVEERACRWVPRPKADHRHSAPNASPSAAIWST